MPPARKIRMVFIHKVLGLFSFSLLIIVWHLCVDLPVYVIILKVIPDLFHADQTPAVYYDRGYPEGLLLSPIEDIELFQHFPASGLPASYRVKIKFFIQFMIQLLISAIQPFFCLLAVWTSLHSKEHNTRNLPASHMGLLLYPQKITQLFPKRSLCLDGG